MSAWGWMAEGNAMSDGVKFMPEHLDFARHFLMTLFHLANKINRYDIKNEPLYYAT